MQLHHNDCLKIWPEIYAFFIQKSSILPIFVCQELDDEAGWASIRAWASISMNTVFDIVKYTYDEFSSFGRPLFGDIQSSLSVQVLLYAFSLSLSWSLLSSACYASQDTLHLSSTTTFSIPSSFIIYHANVMKLTKKNVSIYEYFYQ